MSTAVEYCSKRRIETIEEEVQHVQGHGADTCETVTRHKQGHSQAVWTKIGAEMTVHLSRKGHNKSCRTYRIAT